MSETTEAFVARHMNDSPMELYLLRDELHYSAQRYRFRMARGGEDNLAKIVSIIDEREKAIDALILQREKASGMSVEQLEYPEGFIDACRAAYETVGPIYKARQVCGCWVFRTTKDLTIGGSFGVIIESGEPVFFHVNAMDGNGSTAKALAKKLGVSVAEMQVNFKAKHVEHPELRVPSEFQVDG